MALTRELAPDDESTRPLVRVLDSLADEVGALLLGQFGGRSRELAMVITNIQQARLWAIAHGEQTGSHVVMDRREVLGEMGT